MNYADKYGLKISEYLRNSQNLRSMSFFINLNAHISFNSKIQKYLKMEHLLFLITALKNMYLFFINNLILIKTYSII